MGRTVTTIDRRAKYLLFNLDDGVVVIAHLGMSGRMVIELAAEELPRSADSAITKNNTRPSAMAGSITYQ